MLFRSIIVESQSWKADPRYVIVLPNVNFLWSLTSVIHLSCQFGKYLGFTFYELHIIVLWEGHLGIFPMPSAIPSQSTTVVKPSQIYALAQRVQSPVCFSSCRPRQLPGTPYPGSSSSEDNGYSCVSVIARCNERIWGVRDRKSTRLNSSHSGEARMPSSA